MSIQYALVAKLEAKPDKATDVADMLKGAVDLARQEEGTVTWYSARTSDTTFWIFDTFETTEARQAHLDGEIAAALMSKADELLSSPPEIMEAEVLSSK